MCHQFVMYLFDTSAVIVEHEPFAYSIVKFCTMMDPKGLKVCIFLQFLVYFHLNLDTCKLQCGSEESTTLMKARPSDVAVVCMIKQFCVAENYSQEKLVKNCKNRKKFNFTKRKQQLSQKLTLMKRNFFIGVLFVFSNCFVRRDHRQITFVTLTRFCSLNKTNKTSKPPNEQYQDEWNTKKN